MECPACSGKRHEEVKMASIYRCKRCGALHGHCYLGESYEYVLPHMTDKAVPPEQTRYYDFMCLGSKGEERRHGWYDPATRLIVQVG